MKRFLLHFISSGPFFLIFFLLFAGPFLFSQEQPISEVDSSAPPPSLLQGSFRTKTTRRNDQWYLHITIQTNLPEGALVQTILYYRKKYPDDQNPHELIDVKAGEATTKTSPDGTVQVRLLNLERPIWAGPYKLELQYDPKLQPKKLKNKHPDLKKQRTRVETWYIDTPEKRKKQKKTAFQKAENHYKRLIELYSMLRSKIKIKSGSGKSPSSSKEWFSNFEDQLNELWEQNEKRPEIEFHFVEQRTGHFLKYDIKKLKELYESIRKRTTAGSFSEKNAQKFRKKLNGFYRNVKKNMKFLGLQKVVSSSDRKRIQRALKNISNTLNNKISVILKKLRNPEQSNQSTLRTKLQEHIENTIESVYTITDHLPGKGYRLTLNLLNRLKELRNSITKPPYTLGETELPPSKRAVQNLRQWFQKRRSN